MKCVAYLGYVGAIPFGGMEALFKHDPLCLDDRHKLVRPTMIQCAETREDKGFARRPRLVMVVTQHIVGGRYAAAKFGGIARCAW